VLLFGITMNEDQAYDYLHDLYVRLADRQDNDSQPLSQIESQSYYALRYYFQTYNGGVQQVIYNCEEEIPAMVPGLKAVGAHGAARLLRRASQLSWTGERSDGRALSKQSIALRDKLDDASLDGLPEVLAALLSYVARTPELTTTPNGEIAMPAIVNEQLEFGEIRPSP
jgi:hypothetical protein